MGYGSGVVMSCGVGHRCSSDLALLWLWCRLAATALIRPLAWESPYAMGMALKRRGRKGGRKEGEEERKERKEMLILFLDSQLSLEKS